MPSSHVSRPEVARNTKSVNLKKNAPCGAFEISHVHGQLLMLVKASTPSTYIKRASPQIPGIDAVVISTSPNNSVFEVLRHAR